MIVAFFGVNLLFNQFEDCKPVPIEEGGLSIADDGCYMGRVMLYGLLVGIPLVLMIMKDEDKYVEDIKNEK